MQKNKTLVFAVAIFAMLLMSPMLIDSRSVSMRAFATNYNASNNSNETSNEIYVNGTSHDGTLVVHIESKVPKAGESLPTTIYFTDANGTELKHVHYRITAQQDGNEVLSLPHVYLNQGNLEYNTQLLSSDNQVSVQVTILGIGLPYDRPHWTGPIGDVIELQIGSTPPPSPSLSVSTDQSSYHHGDTTTVKAALQGYGQGQNIAITVTNPTGDVIVSRTIVTDENGAADLQFRISDRYQDGTYQVVATAYAGNMVYKDTTEFSVESQPAPFTIVLVQATDQNGNPVSSFSRGSTGYAKVIVSADSNQTALLTADLFDSNSVSLGIGSVKTNLGAGESQMIVSFFVPKDAVVGSANIYANAFSDWPSNGGIPLTGEASTSVEIQ
jgi:hypothetical protein